MPCKPTSYVMKMSSKIAEIRTNNFRIYVDQSLESQVKQDWFTSDYWHQNDAIVGQSSGRNTAFFIDYNDLKMVLRRYYRGGLMAKISRDSYLFTGYDHARASAEIQLLEKMHNLGLPVPRPIAAIVERSGLLHSKNAILIERIANATDAYQDLLKHQWSAGDWQKMGQLIRLFHDHGVYHSDMNIHNILLDDYNKFWLIDFDKCAFKAHDDHWKQGTLDRLKRSLNKEKSKHQDFNFKESDWQDVMNGYDNKS